jgi:KUP system potassium uptake protein
MGAGAVARRLRDTLVPIPDFMAKIERDRVPRVPGTAVFLTRTERDTPPVMIWLVKHNRALHERVFIVTVIIRQVPWARSAERLAFQEIAPGLWRATARYGFMERPDIPALLAEARERGCGFDLSDVIYYVGHETVVHREDGPALPKWIEQTYAAMQRNSVHVSDFFRLPAECVVEIGREVAI